MPQLTSCITSNDETNAAVLLIFPSAGSTASPCGGERERRRRYSQLGRLDVFGRALDGVAVLCGELGDELEQGGALVLDGLAVAAEQGLVLSRQDVDPCLELGQTVSDVMHQ